MIKVGDTAQFISTGGNVNVNSKNNHSFEFINNGSEPLKISNAKGSCGCTVPEWPKEPISPGSIAKIKVTFDSKGKIGQQSKRVTLMTNAIPNVKILTIKGEIITN